MIPTTPFLLSSSAVLTHGFLLAQSTAGNWWDPLINAGGIGAVLAWFMFRNEPRLRAIEAAIDRGSRAILILVMSVPHLNDAVKQPAQKLIDEIDEAAKQREKVK